MPNHAEGAPLFAHVSCASCRYDLRGLTPSSICPECCHPIADSIANAPAAQKPWPKWLQNLRTIYFTIFGTTIASPLVVPPIVRLLGPSVVADSSSMLFWSWLLAALANLVIGGILLAVLALREDPLFDAVGLTLVATFRCCVAPFAQW